MHILWTIIIGFLAGLIAKLTTPGRDPRRIYRHHLARDSGPIANSAMRRPARRRKRERVAAKSANAT